MQTTESAALATARTAEVLTVEEAAEVLRIGRNAAYALARRWRESDGLEGIPCVELGRTLRVPRQALVDLLAGSGRSKAPPSEI